MAGHFVHQQRAGEATAAGGAVDARREGTVIADNHDLDGNSECLFDTTERGSGPRRTDAGSSETRCTVPWPAWPPGQSSGGRRCSFSQSAGRLPARRRSRLRPAPEERRAAKWGSGHSVSMPLVEPPRGLVGARGCADLRCGRAGKDVARDGGRQHARPDKPGVRGLVPSSAAADHRDVGVAKVERICRQPQPKNTAVSARPVGACVFARAGETNDAPAA